MWPASTLADLARALAVAPEHLSWYQLTLEPNTRFYSAPPLLPLEDELAALEETVARANIEDGMQVLDLLARSWPWPQTLAQSWWEQRWTPSRPATEVEDLSEDTTPAAS